ncbi:MAG TPA: YlxR family protein, partial [Streptosporangiaceae bacterium]|nr:YlxR family protein [Streptosporangiaceae bacterium]
RAAKSDLLRVVAVGGEIIPDPAARMPGRGAYLHSSQECWERARRRRAFQRALRLREPLRDGGLAEHLAGSYPGGEPPG